MVAKQVSTEHKIIAHPTQLCARKQDDRTRCAKMINLFWLIFRQPFVDPQPKCDP